MDITQKLAELDAYIPHYAEKNAAVSEVTVGWHIGHSLRVVRSICKQLMNATPDAFQPAFSVSWQYVKLRKGFARGVGKAPRSTFPPEQITEAELQTLSAKTHQALEELLVQAPQGAYFDHPYFGHLDYSDSLLFLAIHTHHHLKIIRDILKP